MSSPETPSPRTAPARPGARAGMLARLLLALLILIVTLAAGLWGWAGSEGSLAAALRMAAPYLPADMQLQAEDVSGSVRAGGRIGRLQFSSPRMAVQLHDARVAWQLAPLLQRRLVLTELHAARITLHPQGTPDPTPADPLDSLVLPLTIHLPFAADTITWAAQGQAPVVITDLRGRYDWDGNTHRLQVQSIALAQGRYALHATLQGVAPMALAASLQGTLQTPVPGSDGPLSAQVQAQISGTLAGAAAQLALSAQMQGETGQGGAGSPPHLDAQAVVQPWASQPLQQAHAVLEALDLAALWPQAPATHLGGEFSLQPQELSAHTGWALEANLTNKSPGPWDAHRLPVSALQASARYDGAVLTLPKASLHFGTGVLRLNDARYDHTTRTLAAQLALHALSPARLHSLLDAAPVDGTAQVSGQLGGALQLQARLSAAPAQSPKTLHLDRLAVDGQWQGQTLHLRQLDLSAQHARLQGKGVTLNLGTRSGSGQFNASLPGAALSGNGTLAERSGQGDMDLTVSDAQALQRWLSALPLPQALPSALTQAQIDGKAQLQAHWQGGWLTALQQIQGKGKAGPDALALQARLSVPRLGYQPAQGPALALSGVQARLHGTLAQATFSLDGSASQGAQAQRLGASIHLRAALGLRGAQRWQAQINALALDASMAGQAGPWHLQLLAPLTLDLATEAGLHLQASASEASLTGPQPGNARLAWQATQLAIPHDGSLQLRSQGSVQGLPLAWANAADTAQPPLLDRLGIRGDLVLGGSWDVAVGPTLQARMTLARSSGDLHLLIDGQDTAAGLQQAELTLKAHGAELAAQLTWNSQRAGRLSLQATAPLLQGPPGHWRLDAGALLAGQLHAALPDVGVWSLMAPPGWRLHGSLAADVQLAGRLNAPQLRGEISADGLALRSVLDGVDLKDGRLRARLDGDRLTLTELKLAGGSSSGARIAGPSGNRTSAPKDGGSLHASGQITWQGDAVQMDVTAQAHALQALVRVDRQLSVSGQVRAQLQEGRLALTGQLKTDRASILLPEGSAPKLGDDVVVVRPGAGAGARAQPESRVQPARAPSIHLTLDMGDDFAIQGHGLTTRLKGSVTLTSSGADGSMPRVLGEIRTEQGRYRAWGQMLDVDTGLLRFSGAMDNPQLDILALRPQISQRVGVQVSGSAQAPRLRLYSDPDMPDAEKLSWLVLGRSAAAGGADAALMQQAALALLSGGRDPGSSVAQRLGLDEIGFRGPSAADADNPASGAALTLGKRLSRDLYVTYEHSLAGAVGTLSIFLDLSRRLTLRGQTGAQSALDLIYTIRYD